MILQSKSLQNGNLKLAMASTQMTTPTFKFLPTSIVLRIQLPLSLTPSIPTSHFHNLILPVISLRGPFSPVEMIMLMISITVFSTNFLGRNMSFIVQTQLQLLLLMAQSFSIQLNISIPSTALAFL